jgi:beta-fructofuranosidase
VTPQLHFAPAKGWLNDPNGLIEYRGRHHLFFQHNAEVLAMKDMVWGHASSSDLVNWVEHPIALTPGSDGDYDADGCWSGCAVDTGDGVALIYSGNHHHVQLPCLATSTDDDLIEWAKATDNPVIDRRPPVDGITDMRDHSVRRDGDRWRQVVAAGVGGEGMLFGFSSEDLHRWSWDGIVLRADQADLPGFGWECPDVFELDGWAVAIFSVMDQPHRSVAWVTGQFDGPKIVPEHSGVVDFGDRVYAPQSYTDAEGRRILFGWIQTQDDAAAAGGPSIGTMTVPRQLRIVDGVLHQAPVEELLACRRESTVDVLSGGGDEIKVVGGDAPALEIHIEAASGALLGTETLELADPEGRTFAIDLASFGGEPARAATVLVDAGIVEVFLDSGRAGAWTDLGLATVSSLRLTGAEDGGVTVTQWALARPPL